MAKGYKGMKSDMTCRGFQYEIGKSYQTDKEIKLCENGFHFCKELKDVFDFYEREAGCRFFEVEGNIIETDGVKSVTDKLYIIRELTIEEVNRCYYDSDYYDRGFYSGNGYNGYSSGNGDGFGFCYSCKGNGYNGYRNGDGNGYGYSDGYYGYRYIYSSDSGCGYNDIEKILIFI